MRRALILAVMAVLIPGVAHAGGGGGSSICPGHAEGNSIVLLDSCFNGTAHFAPAGQTLTIRNDGQAPHDFTAVDGTFATGIIQGGQSATISVDETGIYKVFCTLHGTADGQGMAGVLIVGEAAPGMVSATLDLSPVKAAVEEQTDLILQAMDNQGRAMGKITASQDDIAAKVDHLSSAASSPDDVPAASAGDGAIASQADQGKGSVPVIAVLASLGLVALAWVVNRWNRGGLAGTKQ